VSNWSLSFWLYNQQWRGGPTHLR